MLTLLDEFCGLGGSTEGAAHVPGVEPAFAANHNPQAIDDRHALVTPTTQSSIDDCRFRMLHTTEVQAAMAFPKTYQVLPPAKRDRVRLLGNAVTPPTAEILVSALTETITGEELPR